MVTFRKGILKVNLNALQRAKLFYEIAFLANIVVIFTMYTVTAAASVAAIVMFIASVLVVMERNRRQAVIPYVTIWYLLLIGFGALSGLWAQYLSSYNFSFILRLLVILLISTSVAVYVDKPEDLERIITLYLIGMLAIVAFETSVWPPSLWKYGSLGSHYSQCNPNDISYWMDFGVAMAFYRAYVKNKKYMYPVALLLFLFCVYSSSRKGLLAGVAGPLAIVFLTYNKRGYIARVIVAVLGVIGVYFLVMENETLYSVIGRRIESMINHLNGEETDGSMLLRRVFIDAAKNMFAESPLIGKGMGNFRSIVEAEYATGKYYTHNNYWQLLSELGIIGFIIYYSMYAYCFVIFARNYLQRRSEISILFLTCIVLMFVLDEGVVSYCSKYGQLVVAIMYAATYTSSVREYGIRKSGR